MRPSERLLSDPAYLPYLPLLYVAWADGELAPDEVSRVRRLAAEEHAPGIDDEPVLASWLDPASPPTATDLLRLLRRIGEVAHRVPPEARRSLADLGVALARVQAAEGARGSVALAVGELERALELDGSDVVRGLLDEAGVPWPASPGEPPTAPEAAPLAFDRGALTRLLDGRHHAVRHRVRDLLGRPPFVRLVEPTRAEHRAQVLAWLEALGARRLGALAYPQVLGESEGLGEFIAAFETLADFDLSLLVKFGVQFGLFGGAIYFLGTERHHALLEDVASVRLPGCFAMSEVGHGSNVRELGTTATYDPERDELVVHSPDRSAWKEWIGNAALHGRLAVVFAQLVVGGDTHGVHAVLVPLRDEAGRTLPGITIEDDGPKLGLNGVDNGRIGFDRVRVPRENLLDRYGHIDAQGQYTSPINSPTRRFFTMLGTLVGGRISVASAGVAAARSALTIAVRYGARRRQFGPTGAEEICILDYPAHQERLMPALAEGIVLTLALRDLTERYERGMDRARRGPPDPAVDSRQIEALAAGFKALSTWHATKTIQDARECCGGQGYLVVNRFADLKADTDVFTTFEGDNTVLLQLAARGVLTSFATSLSGQWTGVARHLADRAALTLQALDPVTSRRTDPAHLLDPDWQERTLSHRVQQLTWSAAGRMRARIKGGMDPFFATLEVQDHLLSLGRAWTEHQAFLSARAAREALRASADDAGVGALLDLVLRVYALDRLWAHQAWYLRHGVMEGEKARAIRTERQAAMRELRGVAEQVVDAFDLSDRVLGAPVATS